MNEKNGNVENFVERKASEYVENHGYEVAVEKLGIIAPKSSRAQEMLNVIMKRHAPKPEPKAEKREEGFVENRNPVRRRRNVRPEKLSPKQKYSNIVETTGIGFDARADRNWKPVVPVEWKKGKARINGKEVMFPRDYIGFMKRYVLNKDKEVFNMHILDANTSKNVVIAAPDMDDYHRRRRNRQRRMKEERERKIEIADRMVEEKKEAKENKDYFEAEVYDNGRFAVKTRCFNKIVIIPKRYLKILKEVKPVGDYVGFWKFKLLDDKDNKVIAQPLERISKKERPISNGQLSKQQRNRKPRHNRNRNRDDIRKSNSSFVTSFVSDDRLDELYNNGSVKL